MVGCIIFINLILLVCHTTGLLPPRSHWGEEGSILLFRYSVSMSMASQTWSNIEVIFMEDEFCKMSCKKIRKKFKLDSFIVLLIMQLTLNAKCVQIFCSNNCSNNLFSKMIELFCSKICSNNGFKNIFYMFE